MPANDYPKQKFKIGDIVKPNVYMDNNIEEGLWVVTNVRGGFDDYLIDVENIDTKSKEKGYYQYRFDLVNTKKGNVDRYV